MDRILGEQSAGDQLPPLRDDLEIVKGSPMANGAPSWVIYDPVSERYFEIGREVLDQLSMWSVGTINRLSGLLFSELGREVSEDDIKSTIHFLVSNSLVRDIPGNDYRAIVEKQEEMKKSILSMVTHGYLFFRIPLFRPDRFLTFTWPYVRFLFTKTSVVFFVLLAIIGFYLTSRQWDQFTGTFQYMLSIEGFLMYGLSLIFVKSLHELGHAFMATKYGLRVPTIGIAFMVLMPILYTDTSAAWRLPSRRKRLMIDAAGIFTELAIATLATIIWVFLPDGGLRLAVFTIATTGWVSSLAVNTNPFMRFDGYYILSDFLGFQNLQERGFEMARWRLRELLFAPKLPPPEILSVPMRRTVIVHAWATWIYRFFLFLGIALLVYTFFIKVVGILLFVVEIIWFILLPVFRELKRWWKMRSKLMKTRRAVVSLGVLGLVVTAVLVPWSTRISIPSVLIAEDEFRIYPPYPAKLAKLYVTEGKTVMAGDVLFQLEAPVLDTKFFSARERAALIKARIDRIGSDDRDRTERIVLINKLASINEELQGLKRLLDELSIRAQFDGTIVDLDPEIQTGMWISNKQPLALLHGKTGVSIKGYVAEANLFRFREGAQAAFFPEDPALARISLKVDRISYAGAVKLDEPYLALQFGGSIATIDNNLQELIPKDAYYAVRLFPSNVTPDWQPQNAVRGNTIIQGTPESLFNRAKRSVLRVLVREVGI